MPVKDHLFYRDALLTFKWQSLSKSGPQDFGTTNNFASFFVSEKGLAHVFWSIWQVLRIDQL